MIDAYTISDEKVSHLTIGKVSRKNSLFWVRSINPSDDEIKELSRVSKIPFEDLKGVIDEDERPRIEQYSDYTLIVYKAPSYEDGEIVSSSFVAFIKDNLFITIESKPLKAIEKIIYLILKKKAKFLFLKGPGFLLYQILDRINDEFLHIIDRIGNNSDVLRGRIGDFSKKNIESIYSINLTLSHFNQALLANAELLNSLRKVYRPFTKVDRDNFSDLYYDLLQIIDTEKIQREVITNMFKIESVMNDYNLNQSMKRLTSIMLILMIPTLISGIYGMNFTHLPFAGHPYGFWIILFMIVTLIVLALVALKKADWI